MSARLGKIELNLLPFLTSMSYQLGLGVSSLGPTLVGTVCTHPESRHHQ